MSSFSLTLTLLFIVFVEYFLLLGTMETGNKTYPPKGKVTLESSMRTPTLCGYHILC